MSPPNRPRPPRPGPSKPPGPQPSEIANAILDLSNRAEWAKLAIGKLKPAQSDAGQPADRDAAVDREDEGDRPSA